MEVELNKCPFCNQHIFGIRCIVPNCMGLMVKRGIIRGKQRYICKVCKKIVMMEIKNNGK